MYTSSLAVEAFFGDYCGAFKESCYAMCSKSSFQSPNPPQCNTRAKAFECTCVNYLWLSRTDLTDKIKDNLKVTHFGMDVPSSPVESLLVSRLVDHIPELRLASSNSTLAHPNGSPLFHMPIEAACSRDYNYDRCVIASITRLATSSQKFKFRKII
ncbi:hypothetical protein DSO57_1001966 [Entomophthora muscae]|uniref:Uncharacterized protein n=1 Tax=Entomophthora muscae TaxID=34485 RepID=A0ACC2UUZ4_9FUNG|nr:hypothetical protein DSO57_1001966 [Entomophthora muscae]